MDWNENITHENLHVHLPGYSQYENLTNEIL